MRLFASGFLFGFALFTALNSVDWGSIPSPFPVVDPPPFPASSLTVVVTYETDPGSSKLTRAQREIITSVRVREWLDKHCPGKYRFFDQDQSQDVKYLEGDLKAGFLVERPSLPWLAVSNGKTGFSGSLPADVDAFIALLESIK